MAIADDLSVSGGDIRWTGGAATYTVLELHRFLQDLADNDSSAGDDLLDITLATPSNRQTDNIIELLNGFNIDDTVAQHLYDGSIIQNGGDDIYEGIRVFSKPNTYLNIIQNGALATNFWTSGLNADATNGVSHRFLILVRSGGTDIDGRRLIGTTREWGKTYSEFKINGTSRGNNVIALTYNDDLNNQTLIATIAALADITNTEGYVGLDVDNNASDEYYYSEWDIGANSLNTFYEYTKWLTRRGTSSTLYGLNGALFRGITHAVTIDTPTGTFVEPEALSWSTGTGQLLAINSTTAGTQLWMQLLTGVAPTDGLTITGGTSGATCDVNVTVTEQSIVAPFIGASTGSAINGAYGVGIQLTDINANCVLTDLSDTTNVPPNYVTFTINNLVVGDRVLVTNDNGSTIDYSQFTINGNQSAGAGTLLINEAIPDDTPATGNIRVQGSTNGSYDLVPYASWSGSTFTLTGTLPDDVNTGENVFLSYIDEVATGVSASFTTVYDSDRTIFIRVRNGSGTPIKTFETTGTLGSAGGSATTIRTSDA